MRLACGIHFCDAKIILKKRLSDDKDTMLNEKIMPGLDSIMAGNVFCIDMDTTVGRAIELCSEKRIRHLPVLDDNKVLVGVVTDRDLRYFISPRLGTLSENNSDRATLTRHVHQVMVRQVTCVGLDTTLPEAAQLMLTNSVGCLPVLDSERHVVGILTKTDLLRYIANNK
jgi:acetoin utilization protein AcuB